MKNYDLFSLCRQNLKRHKSRTRLTVLGVAIGCCAIVVMISIGIGMKEAQEIMLSEMGDLTVIEVSQGNNGTEITTLDDQTLAAFEAMDGVEATTPKVYANLPEYAIYGDKQKRYKVGYPEMFGMNPDALEKLGYEVIEGEYMGKKPFDVLVGENFFYSFIDTKRPEGMNMRFPSYDESMPAQEPFLDSMSIPLTIEINVSDTQKVTQQLRIVGMLKEDYARGYETYQGIIMNIKDLLALQKEASQHAGGKTAKVSYNNVIVKVDELKHVSGVEASIKEMGYSTYSMDQIRESMEKDARQKQMMLGGLGAISLFVAALGITNTMIMSITERTREIGIMKALGCYVRDIRGIFLLEAGCIGLIGGIVGNIISVIISVAMNLISKKDMVVDFQSAITILSEKGSRMSVVPWWLLIFALVFAIVIGLVSGYYPSNKAVKIPALEAIKHD